MYRRESSNRPGIEISRGRNTESILRELYQLYYSHSTCIEEPPDIQHREFAFQHFGSSSYVRHISFESYEELLDYLSERPPKHAYYSVAKYELPEAESMEEKGWLGSSLLFDLDLDHVKACEGLLFDAGSAVLMDDQCLVEGYRIALRLRTMIKRDLAPESLLLYYTGHRGFHIRVDCSGCETLDKHARRHIAKYFAGEDVVVQAIFPARRGTGGRKRSVEPAVPSPEDPGWRGWLAPFIRAEAPGALSLKQAYGRNWPSRLEELLREAAVPIDVMVTQDPTRLTRLLGSLNGKASLLVVEADRGFMPGKNLSPFYGETTIRYLVDSEPLRILGVDVSPRRGSEETLPAHVAIYLATKGVVELLEGEVFVGEGACGRPI